VIFFKQVVMSCSIIVLFRSSWVKSYSPSSDREKACTDGDLKQIIVLLFSLGSMQCCGSLAGLASLGYAAGLRHSAPDLVESNRATSSTSACSVHLASGRLSFSSIRSGLPSALVGRGAGLASPDRAPILYLSSPAE
jgi:hypothetical protein